MGKESWIRRLLRRIGLLKSRRLTFEEKAEMCRRAVYSGVCPKDCDRCAWSVLE